MKKALGKYQLLCCLLFCLLQLNIVDLYAQEPQKTREMPKAQRRREQTNTTTDSNTKKLDEDALKKQKQAASVDSINSLNNKNLNKLSQPVNTAKIKAKSDSINKVSLVKAKPKFTPDPQKSTWIALAIPGGGQIYNRKYWKLPFVYGGFVGCAYALHWNNQMYSEYSQAYLDIMSNDPSSTSYLNFLPDGYDVKGNLTFLQNTFKKKKDYYRRYRDLSIFAFIGVYILSVVDAYVDAELSNFDITNDLSFKVSPAFIRNSISSKWSDQAIGLQCSITF